MTRISNKTAYPLDVTISDEDYVIGSDGDNLGKITRNYNIGDLRRYINSGLSPEVGGTLKVSEITYNGVLTSPSEVANALDPNYQVLQYHIVIFSVNGNKYILKEQDITLGLSGTAVTDEDFILIIGFTKLGDGTNVLKGYNTSTGLHEFYSIKKDGNLLNLTESLGNIVLSIDETELSEFIKENGKTYSVLNVGTGVGIYKDTTVAGDNTQFNFKSIKSNSINITLVDDDIFIDTPESAIIPALYVNNLYIPTYQEWLEENKVQNGGTAVNGFVFRGKGTLAQPFTDSTVYLLAGGSPTITPNTAIQNALDGDSGAGYATKYSYQGTGTRLSPQRGGQKINIQDNTVYYNFAGNFGYSLLNIDIGANVNSTTTGYLVDMDNTSHFNNLADRVSINVLNGYALNVSGDGFNNSGTNITTLLEAQSKGITLKGRITSVTNDINKYLINSDIASTGNNNDGALTFYLDGDIYAEKQGLIRMGGVSRVWNYGKIQSSTPNTTINPVLKAYLFLGGSFRSFEGSRLEFSGVRTDGFVFTPTGGFTPQMVLTSTTISSLNTITNLFNKTTTDYADLVVNNSNSSTNLIITNIFESPNLWSVVFSRNIFESGVIDNTIVDLTVGNLISVFNNIGANILENLVVYASKDAAKSAGLVPNSAFTKRNVFDAVDLVAGVEYKVVTSGSPSLGAVGDFFTATGSETGTGRASLETREIL